MIEYKLIRSNRKTTAIYVRNGSVEVRAPHRVQKCDIDRFVSRKEQWILKTLANQQTQAERKKSFTINYNCLIILRGKPYPIITRKGMQAGFDDEGLYMPPGLSPEQIKPICVKLYKMLAKVHISNRVVFFATQMEVSPSAVKINSAKTRWGSCSSQKSLNFSWRLIMADDDIIDYVVVHELAHIKEMNHSAQFWAIVKNILPDYQERKSKLKELHQRLSGEDWE